MEIGNLVEVNYWGKLFKGKVIDIWNRNVIVVQSETGTWYDLIPSDKEFWSVKVLG